MIKVTFVGEAPSSRPGLPLSGQIGKRLALLAGLPEAELRRRCEMINLLPDCPPLAGKGRTCPAAEAEAAAERLEAARPDGAFVLLGKRVARAFGLVNLPSVCRVDRFLVIPHPSGIVLFWNRVGNRQKAAIALRRFLSRHGVIPKTKKPGRAAPSAASGFRK